jgi:hypothetical protein
MNDFLDNKFQSNLQKSIKIKGCGAQFGAQKFKL